MKKQILIAASLAIIIIAGYHLYKVHQIQTSKNLSKLVLANIEALADGEDSDKKREKECHDEGGYWDMVLICTDGGIEETECTVSGELSIAGFKISGSYKKGEVYSVSWERWECKDHKKECCIKDEQGVRIN